LLAGGRKAVDASADQAFFYEARLRLAQAISDPHAQVQLLRNALADTPGRDDARIPLFQAAAVMRSDEFARSVMDPLVKQQVLSHPAAVRETEIFDSETELFTDATGELNAALRIPIAQQAQVAWLLGEVLVRLDRPNEAMLYMRLAYKLEKAPDRRKQIGSTITSVRAQVRRQQLNAGRQPILHEALEQDRLVRPRLLARTAPLPKGTRPKGGLKQ
jgi:hypothetical protein